MTEVKKKESNLKTIKNCFFVYTSVTRPQKQLNKDNKPPLSDNALEFHAWEIKILVSETTFKAMKKHEKMKGAKNFPNVKEYTAEECVDKFGIEEPEEDMVLIKFSQGCLTGKKNARKDARQVKQIGIKKNKTPNGDVYYDKNGLLITQDTNVGNGSKGHLQINPVENDYGLYLYPTTICITELVEYEAAGESIDEDAFGIEEMDEDEVESSEDPDESFDEDDDIPF